MLIRNPTDYGFSQNIAKKCGISAALVLQRIIWSINIHHQKQAKYASTYLIDGQWWMDDTFAALAIHFEGILSLRTIKRAINDLEEIGILIGKKMQAGKWDHTKWYSIDIAAYENMDSAKMAPSTADSAKMAPSRSCQNDPIDSDIVAPSSSSISHTIPLAISPPPPSAELLVGISPIARKVKESKYSPEDLDLGAKWLDFAIKEKGGEKYANWTIENFAKEFAKIRRIAGYSSFGLEEIFNFVLKDVKFWRSRAISPFGLLEFRPNGCRKIDNILTSLKGAPKYKTERESIAIDEALAEFM